MDWQEISGSWVWLPQQPIGIIHFLGGAFVASAPQLTYRWLLTEIGKAGYAIVATPFVNTFDHLTIARSVLNRFETIVAQLQSKKLLPQGYLPIYGVGHSMGCKLHLLIGSLFSIDRAGNILISYNNFPARRAIPLVEQLDVNQTLNFEFTPSPQETNELVLNNYLVRRNLLIRFNNDDIDQSLNLNPLLQQRFAQLICLLILPGNHLTPLGQEITWQTGEFFTPLDAFGQWFKQGLSQDSYRLKQEILRWLNPVISSR
ncbi:DUF1350 family protein [Gloeocapsa sp. PCC 73106]|uniref:DUF1350 family protein n=1 Tax=Gloeocapsa sp. PCC 73106 TaxID=102232 RepID=UPI0002AB9A81|nr:DUF1350 family protein [Gloeocapsa sp. PCC 73106]ELR99556.1 Protein of unknown function (DUF1350) [Gloeocapsa sp. PCC 73106]